MNKSLNIFTIIMLLLAGMLSCSSPSTATPLTATSTPSPTKTNTAIPISTLTATPTRTPRPTSTITPLPSWVTNFAEPILTAIKDHQPSFEDDFSRPTGKGWYIGFIGHPKYGLVIENETLLVTLNTNEGCEPVSNTAMTHPNFVLQVDFPGNYGDVEFHGFMGGGPRHFFTVKGQGASLQWGFGIRDNYGKQQLGNLEKTNPSGNVSQGIIIKRGSKAAFYLNTVPIAYIDDPILDAPIHGVMLNCGKYDNVKFWNLDKIPNLP